MKTEKIILILILFLSLSIYGQTIEEIQNQIRAKIQIQTGFDYYVYVKKAVSDEFVNTTFSDPNDLLDDCYLFLTRSAPMDDGTSQNSFMGIFKNNNIIWQSPHIINADNSWGFYFSDIRDLNKDQSIEIISIWLQGMSAYSEDIWIVSWDGATGKIANEYTINGRSDINIVTGSLKIVDVEGDGIFEIDGIALQGEEEVEKIYSWNNGIIGDFGVTVPQVYPRNRVEGNVKAIVTKHNDLYSYKYIIKDSVNSPQSIELFAIDCNISTQTATRVPTRWDFSNIYDRNLFCWNYNIIVSSNYYNYLIHPGEIEDNFLMVSNYLPIIAKYYLQGNNGDVSIDIDEIFYNTSTGFTLFPTMIDSLEPLSFLDTLITYNQRSSEFGWITNQYSADKYDSLFNAVKNQLQQNNNPEAINVLDSVLTDVEADSGVTLTSEAFALIKYNTEFLKKYLEEKE